MSNTIDINSIPPCTNPKVPEPTVRFTHATDVQLRFNDFDLLGHVNNAIYFELMDLAKARFMESLLHHIDWQHLNVAIVNINSSFFSQAFPDHRLAVLTGVKAIGNKSFTLEQRVVNIDNGTVYVVSTTVFSAYDRATLHSIPLPLQWRTALENAME